MGRDEIRKQAFLRIALQGGSIAETPRPAEVSGIAVESLLRRLPFHTASQLGISTDLSSISGLVQGDERPERLYQFPAVTVDRRQLGERQYVPVFLAVFQQAFDLEQGQYLQLLQLAPRCRIEIERIQQQLFIPLQHTLCRSSGLRLLHLLEEILYPAHYVLRADSVCKQQKGQYESRLPHSAKLWEECGPSRF